MVMLKALLAGYIYYFMVLYLSITYWLYAFREKISSLSTNSTLKWPNIRSVESVEFRAFIGLDQILMAMVCLILFMLFHCNSKPYQHLFCSTARQSLSVLLVMAVSG